MLGPRRRALSSNRTLVLDLLHFDRRMPGFAHDRTFDLSEVARLRAISPVRISWPVLFVKAYGLLSARRPALRQCFFRWPWAHVYEHPASVATVVVNRRFEDEDRLCWATITRPETQSLVDLQERLDRYQSEPVESIFRRQVRLSRLPTPLRRLLWSLTLSISGRKRSARLGTFGLTTLAGLGTTIQRFPTVLTTTLTYGPLDEAGKAKVTIIYDHRVMDGSQIARCLAELEALLQGPIAEELESLQRVAPAKRSAVDAK